MVDILNKNGLRRVLILVNNALKKIGSKKDILLKEQAEILELNFENKEDKELVNSIFSQMQVVNEQMENMCWQNEHYRILHDFAQICSKTLNEETLLKKSYELVSQVMPTDAFYIASYTEGDPYFCMIFMIDNGIYYPKGTYQLGDNYTTRVIKTREIIHHKELSQSQEYDVTIGLKDTCSHLFVPVVIDDQVKGVISAQSLDDFAYRKEHEELLQLIGTQVLNSIETARLYEKIYLMSQTDELTGLKNHRAFHNDLSEYIIEVEQEVTLVMIDSDDLKKVNDQYGHDMGDLYLKALADGIKSISGTNIEGYRYAGDEFMIIIKSRFNEADMLIDRLKDYLFYNTIEVSDNQIVVSFSTGVAFYPEHGLTVDSLKKSADTALYVAKQAGKNKIFFAE